MVYDDENTAVRDRPTVWVGERTAPRQADDLWASSHDLWVSSHDLWASSERRPRRGGARHSRWPSGKRSVVLVGTYPPTACGLATFTANLRAAIAAPGWDAHVLELVDRSEARAQGRAAEVVAQWIGGDKLSVARSVQTASGYDAVLLQHEYGLYSGPDGEEVLEFVRGLERPLVAVLHTVLANPSANQRRILEELAAAAAVVIVQSRAARTRLLEAYGVERSRVEVVPHGAAANFSPLCRRGASRPVVLTWGLLGPGKGVEHAIAAVAELKRRGLDVTYAVVGQTHPKVLAASGETYRARLAGLARELGVADRVHLDDGYRDWDALRALVRCADVVLLPYDSTDQVSSGVLVEALASARPVVATRFPHAEELLAHGAGITVPHADPLTMADALAEACFEPEAASRMAARAYLEAQPLLWPAIGAAYRSLIDEVVTAKRAG
jgi:glycosyltransferase involved in cell wall biosynthesis